MATPPPKSAPTVEERYSGVVVVKEAMRGRNLEVRTDVKTMFRYAALGNCAGLVSANAHRLLELKPTHCDLVAEDGGNLVAYEVAAGRKAAHVVNAHCIGDRRAPCRRHSGSLCEVIDQQPLEVLRMTVATMPSACSEDAEADEATQAKSAAPAILLRMPKFFVVTIPTGTKAKSKLGDVEGYHQVTGYFKHADVLSPIGGGMSVTLGARDGTQAADALMRLGKTMVSACGTGVRSMVASLDGLKKTETLSSGRGKLSRPR